MKEIKNLEDLRTLVSTERVFHLYSAGFAAGNFLGNIHTCGIQIDIRDILVTKSEGNPDKFCEYPVVEYKESALNEKDCILLTVSDRFKDEIVNHLAGTKAEVVYPSPVIFYNDVFDSIAPFIVSFPKNISGINSPIDYSVKRVWTCWWQGEKAAPDIVKACWQSQWENIPEDAEHIIITKDNYAEYITIPDYIMDRFQNGENMIAHLADFIRACLLYRYGGVWLDSTVLLLDVLPDECWSLPLYTWRFDNTHFASKTIWTTWFLGAQKGSLLWQFVMEAFLYYFTAYDKVKYYLTIDYFIAICSNLFEEVLEQFRQIPYNNEKAVRLAEHLHEPFSEESFREYCKDTFLQKLSWHGEGYKEGSMYSNILHKYIH